jgi:xanthine dehydrogenase accessory factor
MREVYERAAEMVRQGTPGVIATVIRTEGSTPREAGAKMVIGADGRTWGTIGGGSVEAAVVEDSASVLREGVPRAVEYELEEGGALQSYCGGRVEILLEPLPSSEKLYIFGAGHVAQPLAEMAKRAGFVVTVVDPRLEMANRERFPSADGIVVKGFSQAAAGVSAGPDVYVVIVTPKHAHDEEVVRVVLDKPYRYIGMIGSRKKVATIRSHLKDAGFEDGVISKLHAPIGLDIGAETPEEIAVSIVAELVAVRRSSPAEG